MRNSQYVNEVNVSVSEMVRLVFSEVMPQHNNGTLHVATICMHLEFLKEMSRVINKALDDYKALNVDVAKGMN
jgi:hypothetical protein